MIVMDYPGVFLVDMCDCEDSGFFYCWNSTLSKSFTIFKLFVCHKISLVLTSFTRFPFVTKA